MNRIPAMNIEWRKLHHPSFKQKTIKHSENTNWKGRVRDNRTERGIKNAGIKPGQCNGYRIVETRNMKQLSTLLGFSSRLKLIHEGQLLGRDTWEQTMKYQWDSTGSDTYATIVN